MVVTGEEVLITCTDVAEDVTHVCTAKVEVEGMVGD